MGPLYEVKESPGKGRGVFATTDIEPGTVIMEESRLMHVEKIPYRALTEAEIHQAFDNLSTPDKARFLALHEGSRSYPSKIMRIYMNNTFRGASENFILLEISLLNHSCTSNAERDPQMEDESTENLLAVKKIAKGEEILHSYHGSPFSATTRVRKKLLQTYYGFDCDCATCNADAGPRATSDMRRILLDALLRRIEGFGPSDYSLIDFLDSETADMLQSYIGNSGPKLDVETTVPEYTAFHLMAGRLLEAEGCLCSNLPRYYARVGLGLLRQMQDMDDVIIVDSYAMLRYWLGEAVKSSGLVRGPKSTCSQDVLMLWQEVEAMPKLKNASQALHLNKTGRSQGSDEEPTFAVLNERRKAGGEEYYHMLEKEHYLQLVRGELTRADLALEADMHALNVQGDEVTKQEEAELVGKVKGSGIGKKKGKGKR
ncbi:hypothetical protein LTR27_005550 [Elasticomyces elasticus]|nr:hypothetical protein LTR27_005550 [Elasticomyces elasticus]